MDKFSIINWRNLNEARYNYKLIRQASSSPKYYAHICLNNKKLENVDKAFPLTNKKNLFSNEINNSDIKDIRETPIKGFFNESEKNSSFPKKNFTRKRDSVGATKIVNKEGSLMIVREALELYNALRRANSPSCNKQSSMNSNHLEDNNINSCSNRKPSMTITELGREEACNNVLKTTKAKKHSKRLFTNESISKDLLRSPRNNVVMEKVKKKLNNNPKKAGISSNFISALYNDMRKGSVKRKDKGKSNNKGLVKTDGLIIQELSYKVTKLQEPITCSRPLFKFNYKNGY